MIVESTPQRCPLCHQPSSDSPGPSRLCAQCRALVRRALPAVNRRAAPAATLDAAPAADFADPRDAIEAGDERLPSGFLPASESQDESAPSQAPADFDWREEWREETGNFNDSPNGDIYVEESSEAADSQSGDIYLIEADDESPNGWESTMPPDIPAPPPIPPAPEPLDARYPTASFADTAYAETPPQPVAPLAVASNDLSNDLSNNLSNNFSMTAAAVEAPAAISEAAISEAPANEAPAAEAAPIDPWENPLPADEFSHNEWPLLVKDEEKSGKWKVWLALAAVVLIAAAAGAYFLLGRAPAEEPRQAPAAAAPSGLIKPEENAAPPSEPAPSTAQADQQQTTQPEASQPQTSQPEANAPAGEGNYTLQAVSVPTQSAAEEYAERLRRAGIASYIVKADLGKRGTYYRVRIGRFATQAEAQSYAAQSRARARAAGFSLDFIVVGYEAPR